MPRRANTNPIFAPSATRRMSIGSVIVMPTPTAGPLIAAITGFAESKMRRATCPPVSRGTSSPAWRSRQSNVLAAAAQVGAGAEPAALAGDDDRAHIVVGVGAVERLDQLPAHRRVNAFSRSGRSSVIVSTWSSTS